MTTATFHQETPGRISELPMALCHAAATRALASLAILDTDSAGFIGFASEKASMLLTKYLPEHSPQSLPETLMRWLRSRPAPPALACVAQRGEDQLMARLAAMRDGFFQLALEEKTLTRSVQRLEALGLTRREAEVLFWIARGKRCLEIAIIVGCTAGTVAKHTEKIFLKLSVETRTAAASIALEALG